MSEVNYPVPQTFTVLDGYDICRSNNLILALVVVESVWQGPPALPVDEKERQWNVDLCRMGVGR